MLGSLLNSPRAPIRLERALEQVAVYTLTFTFKSCSARGIAVPTRFLTQPLSGEDRSSRPRGNRNPGLD